MASHRMRKHEHCAHENCGSRHFREGEDGFTYCDQGHQQSERGTVIAQDTGELVQLGRKSRKKDSDAESATSRGMALHSTIDVECSTDEREQLQASAALMHSSTTCSAYNLFCASSCTG